MKSTTRKWYSSLGIDTTKTALDDNDIMSIFDYLGSNNINWHNDDMRERLLSVERNFPNRKCLLNFFINVVNAENLKVPPTSPKYWLARGFDEQTSIEKSKVIQRNRIRKTDIGYWLSQGHDESMAASLLSEEQSRRSRLAYDKRDVGYRRRKSPRSIDYWLSRGHNIADANDRLVDLYEHHSDTMAGRPCPIPLHKRNTNILYYQSLGMNESEAKLALRQRQTTRYTSDEEKTAFREYYTECWYHTKTQLHLVKDIDKRSWDFHLDHNFSIYDGFRNGVLPQIIGSFVNLRIIPAEENRRKQRHSHIDKDALLYEYENVGQ